MRSCLLAMIFVVLPAATAAAQFGKNPLEAEAQPPEAEQGNVADQGAAPPAGPTSNAMFEAIDVDGDGVITKAELRKAIVALRKFDADKDGNITLAEVSPLGGPVARGRGPAPFIDQVMQYDKDNNGLTPNEVPEELKPMLQNADLNRNSVISREELTVAMENMPNQFPGGPGGGWHPGSPGALNAGAGGRDSDVTGQFMQHDRDGNGLSPDELRELSPRMRAIFRDSDDRDHNGLIDAAELQIVLRRLGDRARALGADADARRTPFRDPNRHNRQRSGNENN